jgi:ATP-dependent RNA helicase DeaD
MLLDPEPVRPARGVDDRDRRRRREEQGTRGGRYDRDGRGRDDRGRDDRGGRPRRGSSSGSLVSYRISVGKRHKVEPRQIVGAIANEGGLGRADFGHIDIRADHSFVELPADLPPGAWDRLRSTRISGRLIELTRAESRS